MVHHADIVVNKAADEVISSTTMQDDDHLTLAVKSGRKYRFRLHLFCNFGSATEGIKLALSGITATVFRMYVGFAGAAPAYVEAIDGETSTSLIVGNIQITVDGYIEPSQDGNLKLRWAQFAGTGLASTTLFKGSWMELIEVD